MDIEMKFVNGALRGHYSEEQLKGLPFKEVTVSHAQGYEQRDFTSVRVILTEEDIDLLIERDQDEPNPVIRIYVMSTKGVYFFAFAVEPKDGEIELTGRPLIHDEFEKFDQARAKLVTKYWNELRYLISQHFGTEI